jgi:GrpB-like predicted nucleotidyltransferase (UPF0157 family)
MTTPNHPSVRDDLLILITGVLAGQIIEADPTGTVEDAMDITDAVLERFELKERVDEPSGFFTTGEVRDEESATDVACAAETVNAAPLPPVHIHVSVEGAAEAADVLLRVRDVLAAVLAEVGGRA